jgi:hypothetical protein
MGVVDSGMAESGGHCPTSNPCATKQVWLRGKAGFLFQNDLDDLSEMTVGKDLGKRFT